MCNYTPCSPSVSSHVPGVQVILVHVNLPEHNKQPRAPLDTSDASVSTPTSKSDRGHETRAHAMLPFTARQIKKLWWKLNFFLVAKYPDIWSNKNLFTRLIESHWFKMYFECGDIFLYGNAGRFLLVSISLKSYYYFWYLIVNILHCVPDEQLL